MRILHIASVPVQYPGGTEKVIWELARRQAINNEVTILQTNLYMKEKAPGEERKNKVKIITCKNDYWLGGFGYSSDFKEKLETILKYYDVVHIHGHGRFTSTYALNFLKNKKPMIYSAQGFFHKKNFIKEMYDLIFGRLLKNATFCTALTQLEEKHLLKKFGIEKEKIKIFPGGTDLKNLKKPSSKEISSFKKKYGLTKRVLIYVGRIHASKGIQKVIEAIKDIDCQFLIVGKDAGFKESLVKQAKELEISSKVIFTDAISDKDLITAYFSSDAFVLYSDWEGFGIVVIEAMATGLPVVVSNNGALPYLVKDGKNGFIAKEKVELKEKIEKALGENIAIIKNGKSFASSFDWEIINKNAEKIYIEAIKNDSKK